jgi:hypothetical protein
MNELLGVTILPLCGMCDDVSPPPPTSMHSQRIGISPSQEPEMPILQVCIEVRGEGDMSSHTPPSGRIATSSNSCMDEVKILKKIHSQRIEVV